MQAGFDRGNLRVSRVDIFVEGDRAGHRHSAHQRSPTVRYYAPQSPSSPASVRVNKGLAAPSRSSRWLA